MKLLLHACCGPCSLEPVRLLQEAEHDLTIVYANSNIAPAEEYTHRRNTLAEWALGEQLPVVEVPYNPSAWEATAGRIGDAALTQAQREARCRACYRLRFEEAARYAVDNNFDAIGTTLSISPYQLTSIIQEELERAALGVGIQAIFGDYRSFYDAATLRSRELGMYRQNYCGCRFSEAEAIAERAIRKRERAAKRAAERAMQASTPNADEAARASKQAERQAHAAKQAHKREVLQSLRNQGTASK